MISAGCTGISNLTVADLNRLGIGRNDRVAIVLPNGPELAVAFLSIAGAATCAPLNPGYTAAEFDFYLSDLGPKALVVQSGSQSPAIDVACARGIPVLELTPLHGEADGLFALNGAPGPGPASPGSARASDVALVLHTSGTTSRPKIVPLTHKNLCSSARNIARTLQLTPDDRCLNIMPLFHIHGLMAGVLASLNAGGSVACTPGFLAPQFFEWMETFKPTWFTAVPTMHQAILERSASHPDVIARSRLRFIRSSSSSLAPNVMEEMETVFKVPVIEAYGMTEASHQMASNPMPPGMRKPGSVGIAAGPEIAIMGEHDARLRPGEALGEIVIRGPSVTLGYSNNAEANQKSFTNGWFRTGDLGYLDADGYLFITGRIKEIINRGGEKISPREVDEVFLGHPAVAQAVTFGVPDVRLGETVAIAVVLKDASVSQDQLRKFAADRLAFFKVPERVLILDEIPKGATGKIQRIGLASKLGLVENASASSTPAIEYVAPRTPVEKEIAEIWQQALGLPGIGLKEPFLRSGETPCWRP